MQVQDVVKRSLETFGEVFPNQLGSDLRLEEVRLSDDEIVWSTTVSFRNPDKPEGVEPSVKMNGLEALLGANKAKERAYKTVRLRDTDGKLLGIVNG